MNIFLIIIIIILVLAFIAGILAFRKSQQLKAKANVKFTSDNFKAE